MNQQQSSGGGVGNACSSSNIGNHSSSSMSNNTGIIMNQGHKQALHQLMMTLKNQSSSTPDQKQRVLNVLKSNPNLMSAFIKQRQNRTNASAGLSPSAINSHVQVTNSSKKDWHNLITPVLRCHFVRKILLAMTSAQDSTTEPSNESPQNLPFAKKVECKVYEIANSLNEYYQLLGEKIYALQTISKENFNNKQLQPTQLTQNQAGSTAVVATLTPKSSPIQVSQHQQMQLNQIPLSNNSQQSTVDTMQSNLASHMYSKPQSIAEEQKKCIERCIVSLTHACRCQDKQCCQSSCLKIKRIVEHAKICTRKHTGDCQVCKKLITLCYYHAKYCNETNCLVPLCSKIKQTQKQLEPANRMKCVHHLEQLRCCDDLSSQMNQSESVQDTTVDNPQTKTSNTGLAQINLNPNPSVSINHNSWRDSISIEYRQHMVHIFSQSIRPNEAAKLGKIIEKQIYEMATSEQEYCRLMLDKISKIQKELGGQHEKRKVKETWKVRPVKQSSIFKPKLRITLRKNHPQKR